MQHHRIDLMSSFISSGAAYSLLTPLTLSAFSPSPENGSIFAPLTAADPSDPGNASQLICNTETAQDLELCTLLMSTEAADLAKAGRAGGQKPPFSIPDANGSSWYLQSETLSPGGSRINQLSFARKKPNCSVFMDFSQTERSLYGIRFEGEEAALSQTISIDSRHSTVATEQFTIRIVARTFQNASVLAWRLSALVYSCGQYDSSELGDLLFRRLKDPGWTRAIRRGKKFASPHLLPAVGTPFSIASRHTIFDRALHKDRPIFNIDLIPADEMRWNVGIVLRRPTGRKQQLMPLHTSLLCKLWTPAFQRITRT